MTTAPWCWDSIQDAQTHRHTGETRTGKRTGTRARTRRRNRDRHRAKDRDKDMDKDRDKDSDVDGGKASNRDRKSASDKD